MKTNGLMTTNFSRDWDWMNSVLSKTITNPYFELTDDERAWQIEVRAPGAKKEDFNITLEDDRLDIDFPGNKHAPNFNYRYTIPRDVEGKHISAKYESGVLTVKINKPKGFNVKIPVG
jgi:HSP20 family protein